MPKVSRILLRNIGHDDARFDPLLLETDGGNNTIVWLDNGGGKTAMISLIFHVIDPNKHNFLRKTEKGKKKRQLKDFIRSGDLACAGIEWMPDDPSNRKLVTLVLIERAGDDLKEYYVSFRAGQDPNSLTLDTLPFEEEGSEVTLTRIKDHFRAAKNKDPRLEMFQDDDQGAWQKSLLNNNIDPQIFEYQRTMSEREGGAEGFLSFSSRDEFIDFVIELVHNKEEAQSAFDVLNKYKDLLRERPERQRELQYITKILPLIKDIKNFTHQRHELVVLITKLGQELISLRRRGIQILSEKQAERVAKVKERGDIDGQLSEFKKQLSISQIKKEKVTIWKMENQIRITSSQISSTKEDRKNLQTLVKKTQLIPKISKKDTLRAEVETLKESLEVEKKPLYERLCSAASDLKQIDDEIVATKKGSRNDINSQLLQYSTEETKLRIREKQLERDVGTLEATFKLNEKRIEDWAREYQRILSAGLVKETDDIAATIKQIKSEIATNNERIEVKKGKIVDTEGEISVSRGKSDKLKAEGLRLKKELEAISNKMDQFRKSWIRVAKSQAFKDLILHGETVENLDHHILQVSRKNRLQDLITSMVGNITREKHELLARENELNYYVENGIFPPDEDTNELKNILSAGGVNAHLAWEYLLMNTNKEDAGRIAKTIPYLIDGIIVPRLDIQKAKGLLATSPQMKKLILKHPIFIATTDCIVEPSNFQILQDDVIVVRDGLEWKYDSDLLESKAHDLEAIIKERKDSLEKEEKLYTSAETCFRNWCSHDENWEGGIYDALTQQVKELGSLSTENSMQLQLVSEEILKKEKNIKSEHESVDSLNEICKVLISREGKLVAFYDNHLLPEIQAKEENEKTRKSLDSRQEEMNDIQANLNRLSGNIEGSKRKVTDLEAEIRDLESGQTNYLEYSDNKNRQTGIPLPSKEENQATFNLVLKEYTGFLKENALGIKLKETQDELILIAKKLRDSISKSGLSEEIVKQHKILEKLLTEEDIERYLEDKARMIQEKSRTIGEMENKFTVCEEDLKAARNKFKRYNTAPFVSELEKYSVPISKHQLEIDELENTIKDCTAAIERRTAILSEFDVTIEALNKSIMTLDANCRDFEGWTREIQVDPTLIGTIEHGVDETSFWSHGKELNASRDEMLRKKNDFSLKIVDRVGTIRAISNGFEYEKVDPSVKQRVSEISESISCEEIDQVEDAYTTRFSSIEALLKDMEKYLEIIIKTLVNQVKDAVSNLKALGRIRVDIEDIPTLQDREFLKVEIDAISDDKFRLGVEGFVLEYIEKMSEDGDIASAMDLIKRAVRRLLNNIQTDIKFLLIKNGLALYKDIDEASVKSGGEIITFAISLYCALIHFRIKRSGAGSKHSSQVLMLDNPIGASSNVLFLAWQKELAKKLNIQLIFWTGVKDEYAISCFDTRIFLKNTTMDNKGNTYVEVDKKFSSVQGGTITKNPEITLGLRPKDGVDD